MEFRHPESLPERNKIMKRQPSNEKRRAAARALFTGEPYSRALAEVRLLDLEEPPIPGAINPNQELLEALVLLAIREGRTSYLYTGRLGDGPAGGRDRLMMISYVVPRSSSIELHVDPLYARALCSALLPNVYNNEVRGIPGLRAEGLERRVRLYWPDRPGEIILGGVPKSVWRKALEEELHSYDDGAAFPWETHPKSLTPSEVLERERAHEWQASSAWLPSGLLRRLGIFLLGEQCPVWVDAWDSGRSAGDGIYLMLEWPKGPTVEDIREALLDELCGLPLVQNKRDTRRTLLRHRSRKALGRLVLRGIQAVDGEINPKLTRMKSRSASAEVT
ncbi:hypothetical protein [Nonomuraea dietziae]|uniref:Uncharacterized protein n=1 Tax=Nonomuraea dietziae TaxID=65515 RepID=A0A7W5V8F1_9ACTN|nr:hypothetical protein [Nonomuraea dietziae]MBB3732496.1 hypothetical protein [Nonomuraea dietziae]